MRVPGRWVVALGLTVWATGCLPSMSSSVSLSPPARADLMATAADGPGSRPSDSAPAPAQSSSKKKWILIGVGAAVAIVAIILIAGGSSDYHPPTDGQVATIR